MKYSKAYYQMQAMIEVCNRNRALVKDQAYVERLIEELESACEMIECAHLEDDFTGEVEDLAELGDLSQDFDEVPSDDTLTEDLEEFEEAA